MASAGRSRAERFEDEKQRIIESCFSKRDDDGSGALPTSLPKLSITVPSPRLTLYLSVCSSRDLHYPSQNHRVLDIPYRPAAARGEDPPDRKAPCHNCRGEEIGPRSGPQDQGKPERDLLNWQDMEPRRFVRNRVLHRPQYSP